MYKTGRRKKSQSVACEDRKRHTEELKMPDTKMMDVKITDRIPGITQGAILIWLQLLLWLYEYK